MEKQSRTERRLTVRMSREKFIMPKFYIETLEGQFIVAADDPSDAVVGFIRHCISNNQIDRALRLHFWVHEGQQLSKCFVSLIDVVGDLSRGEWRYLCFSFHEKRGSAFMRRFKRLVEREIDSGDFE